MDTATLDQKRRATLRDCGASGPVLEEALRYADNPFRIGERPAIPELPMADERHIESWQGYIDQASADGVWPTLQQHLIQLQFPVQEGISETATYRDATRKGQWPKHSDLAACLRAPDGLSLYLHDTPAGRIPVIEVEDRGDFEWLVQALTERNEPKPLPASMGACIVAGFNNWDRIRRHRECWQADNPMLNNAASWPSEFKRLITDKPAYQDRFVILSRGPYSNIPASTLGLEPAEWLERSCILRRDHECTHYFTARALGSMRNNLLDELVADYVGIVAAMGHYDADLARLAFGLEDPSQYRPGGRLENYRGTPALSDPAFEVIVELARRCIKNLELYDQANAPRGELALGQFVIAMTFLTLEEIAAPNMMETSLELLEQVRNDTRAARPQPD